MFSLLEDAMDDGVRLQLFYRCVSCNGVVYLYECGRMACACTNVSYKTAFKWMRKRNEASWNVPSRKSEVVYPECESGASEKPS